MNDLVKMETMRPLALEMWAARAIMRLGQVQLLARLPAHPLLREMVQANMLPDRLFGYEEAANLYQTDPAFYQATGVVSQCLISANAARDERDAEIRDAINAIGQQVDLARSGCHDSQEWAFRGETKNGPAYCELIDMKINKALALLQPKGGDDGK